MRLFFKNINLFIRFIKSSTKADSPKLNIKIIKVKNKQISKFNFKK
jgi:hypothetical protein